MQRSAALILALAGSALAQEGEWRLPERSAAVYRARITDTALERPSFAIDTWAPMLLQGELAREATHVGSPPVSFLGLVPYLAFDLRERRGGRSTTETPTDGSIPALRVRAEFKRPGKGITQTVLAELEPLEKGVRSPSGTLRIDRSFDDELGLVDHFRAQVELDGWTRTEEWAFDRIEEADSKRFRADVAEAIDAGADYLVGRLDIAPRRLAKGFDPGHLALMLFTVFKAGRNPTDRVVARAWEDLKKREIQETYHLACAILAMEALHTPPGERDRIISGEIPRPQPRSLAAEDLEVLQRWTDQLLENGDHTVDVAYRRRWRYTRNDGYDNSNTQYALLGLYAATLCGAKVSRTVWFAAIEHQLDELQDVDGRARRLDVTTHRDLELDRQNPNRTVTVTRALKPGAWGYTLRATPTGSMTTAGIASLTLCEAALTRDARMPSDIRQAVRDARTRGLLWLSDHLTVRANPGDDHHWRARLFYYLYGLERACEFLQIAHLDDRDWYFEGAMQLLLTRDPQRGDVWPRVTDTCFAVLFLKKAAYGPITGRR